MERISYLAAARHALTLPSLSNQFSLLKKSILFVVLAVSIGSGCSTFNNMGALNNSDANIDPQDIAKYAMNQQEVYQALLQLSGLPNEPATPTEWNQFIMAGVHYSNQKCENYLDAVQWSKSGQQRDSSLIGQGGNLTNSIMGIAKASARELAMTAAAFGYTRSTFDTMNSARLSGLEASTIRKLVHNVQQQYLQEINNTQYTNRVGAFNALQGYIRLCLPGNIGAEANNAVRGAKAVSNSNSRMDMAPSISLESEIATPTVIGLETAPLE